MPNYFHAEKLAWPIYFVDHGKRKVKINTKLRLLIWWHYASNHHKDDNSVCINNIVIKEVLQRENQGLKVYPVDRS
jgi:hypothetical protein